MLIRPIKPVPQEGPPPLSDDAFISMDATTPPTRLAPGYVQDALNCVVRETDLVSRPGMQGLLSAVVSGGAIYAPFPYIGSGGTVKVLFVSASGKLYAWTKGGTSATEVLDGSSASLNINGPTARMARYGSFVFIVDGIHDMIRYNGSTGTVVTGLTAPTAFTPLATLTNTTLDATGSAADWSGLLNFSSTEMLDDPSFEGTTAGPDQTWADWDTTGHVAAYSTTTPAALVTPYDSTLCVQLDTPGDTISQGKPVVTQSDSDLGTVVCKVYEFTGFFKSLDTGTNESSIVVTIAAEDLGGNILQSRSFTVQPVGTSDTTTWTKYTFVASFNGVPVDPDVIRLTLAAGATNNPAAKSIFVDLVSLKPVSVRPTIAVNSAGGKLDLSPTATVGSTNGDATIDAGWAVAGMYAKRTYSSPQDWSSSAGVAVIALGLAFAPGAVVDDSGTKPRLRLGLQKSGNAVEWTPALTISDDGTYGFVDVTTLSSTTRAAVKFLYLQFTYDSDLLQIAPPATLITFGPITNSGRLTVGGGDYSYIFIEQTVTADGNILSSGSQYSNSVTPDGRYAQVTVDLDNSSPGGLPVNASATKFLIYRRGGAYSDGLARLLATVDKSSNSSGTGWTWVASTRTFSDGIADSQLEFQSWYEAGRDSLVSGLEGVHCPEGETRAYFWRKNTIYASWQLDLAAGEAGLYTSLTTLPVEQDPHSESKGSVFNISSDNDAETILAIQSLGAQRVVGRSGGLSLGAQKIVFRTNGITLIEGNSPATYSRSPVARATGLGPVSGLSCIIDADGNQTSYVSASGILTFATDLPQNVSLPVQPYIAPTGDDGGSTLTQSALAGSFQVYHDRRRYTFLPPLGGSTNTSVLVFDYRTDSWTRWTLPTAVTGGCSISFAGLPGSLILTGSNGMLFAMQGAGEKTTSGASATAITVTITGRSLGQLDSGIGKYQTLIPSRFFAEIQSSAASTPTVSVTGAVTAEAWSQAWTAASGVYRIPAAVPSRVRGRALTPSITVAVTSEWRLKSWMLTAAAGTDRLGS